MRHRSVLGLPLAILLTTLLSTAPASADPDALWKIVSQKCVPNFDTKHEPAPCALVDRTEHAAALKDLRGATQFLLIPTDRIGGIESPEILAADAPNFWQAAWLARRYMIERAGRAVARENVSLAINSSFARSQNQLHIHIDCVRLDVKQALAAHQTEIGASWALLGTPLAGQHYWARRLEADDLSQANPFKLLADGVPAARAAMGRQTLVVVGTLFADGRPGFYLLTDHVDLTIGDHASGEDLQDHDCAVLK